MNTMNFSESYTYRPKEDWSASTSYQRAETMHQTAERRADFFRNCQ